jgi:sirohydrochlorin cobaltochelatase
LSESTAILLAAFGTTVEKARRSYQLLEDGVRERFPSAEIRWAFTSSMVRAKLLSQGERVLSPAEALAEWSSEGVRQVVVQSVHVTPGEEYERLKNLNSAEMVLIFGRPLLDAESDYSAVLDALANQVDPAVPTVFVGHGNDNDARFNEANERMDRYVRTRFPGALLASLEGSPGPAALEEILPEARRAGRAHFVPLLFVAGDHVVNDLLGAEETSWKNRLGIENVSCGPPLGEVAAIREIYLDHLRQAVEKSRR